jgi:outer membrane murein-binding lipoprotein Lpp
MSTTEEVKAKMATWERHGQTIMLAVVTGTLAFTGKFMWSVNSQLTEIVSDNKHLALQVAKLEGTISAMQTSYITRNEFNPWSERIRTLEDRRK